MNLPQLPLKSDLDEPPPLEETALAIGAMNKGETADSVDIPAEIHKAAGPALIGKLHVLFT